ncbi:hypothetical protein JXA56_04920 [Candidatus Micrarchaeota archaeon]|nr:hypothetical protein [Candidatus Micrarchaeota archaeon]
MRRALFVLLIMGLAFATPEEEFARCHKTCCTGNGGIWNDEYQNCDIGYDENGQRYDACLDQCVDKIYSNIGLNNGCCGPAFLLLGLLFLVYRNK